METRRQSKRKTIGVAATTPPTLETVDSNSSSSIALTTSGASSGGGIPLAIHVQVQLCEEIEANGGIPSFFGFSQKLYHLLNKLVEVDTLWKSL